MPLALASPALAAPSANHATIADLEAIVIAYVERHVEQLLGNGGIMDGTRATFEVFIAELALANVRSIVSDPERLVAFAGPLISAMLNDMLNASLAQISPRVPTIDVSALVARALALLAESELSEALLSTPLVNDMLETAVAYATADAVDYAMSQIIFIPGEADVLELGRRYASEIAGLSVIPFPLTNAFLNTSRVDQGLLLSHSRDFVNPFWTIEIHSHGFLDLQRTYRVTGWQRTVNTDSLAFLANAMPDANIDLRDFSIENYVLLRLGMDVAAGTYEGISNFDVDSFTEALPAITWAAAERAAADVIAEHSTRRER
jgi:hypothetical protein